ncbi:MAG: MBOAT family protein, partial [Bacteroidota bacterium]
WIFFRAGDMETAYAMIRQVFTAFSPGIIPQFIDGYRLVFILMVTGYILHFIPSQYEEKATRVVTQLPVAGKVMLMVLMILIVIQTKSAGIQPFIYFQF